MNQHTRGARFGARLREHRERAAMTLEDVAGVTKIPHRTLQNLEEGSFEHMPGEVFVRGFLRSYARAVGMDPERTVKEYSALMSSDLDVEDIAVSRSLARKKQRRKAAHAVEPASAGAGTAARAQRASKAKTDEPEEETVAPHERFRRALAALAEAGHAANRLPLKVAVGVLAFVAMLTMMLLMR